MSSAGCWGGSFEILGHKCKRRLRPGSFQSPAASVLDKGGSEGVDEGAEDAEPTGSMGGRYG